jgi:hypothetical protein
MKVGRNLLSVVKTHRFFQHKRIVETIASSFLYATRDLVMDGVGHGLMPESIIQRNALFRLHIGAYFASF